MKKIKFNIIKKRIVCRKMYDKGYNGLDLLEILENDKTKDKYLYLIYFDRIK